MSKTKISKPSKKYAAVSTERCAACGACAALCPRGAIAVWHGCYADISQELCIGCGRCARECPAGSIEIRERGV
ncbi:MAG: 4Fe-4S binding protein [Anaerovibrio sp.]|nr:4Fe-4S binding protein [Anaerovibrio sp.]